MKTAILTLALALCAFSTPKAIANCHFNTDLPIVCTEGITAAMVWQKFGNDDDAIRQSYNQRIMHAAGCGTPYDAGKHTYLIELVNQGRSATESGWVPISVISVDHNDIWYIANAYLQGACAKYNHDTGE